MTVRLVGANPGLTLRSTTGVAGYASVWRVDWSERGSGRTIVVWHDGQVRILGDDPDLGHWLADDFTRHFPEVDGLDWPGPEVTVAPVELTIDLETGMAAKAADVSVEISEPIRDPKPIHVPDFDLGGTPHVLTNVLRTFSSGRLSIGGTAVPGRATAFLAEAEVWSRA